MNQQESTRIQPPSEARITKKSALRLGERGRQVTRLLDLLRALERSRCGLTVQQLIEQLDLACSERTVYRDIQHLQSAGFAVVQEEARYRVVERSLDADALRPSQVLALLLARDLMAPLRGLPLEAELQELNLSLLSRLTPEGRAWVSAMRQTLIATTPSELTLRPAIMETIEEALAVEQLLELQYKAPEKQLEARKVEPHLLWCHGTKPYLVAYCHKAAAFRTFALQRIVDVQLLDQVFEVRSGFDASEYVQENFGAYRGTPQHIIVRFEPSVAHLATERKWHATQTLERLDDGSISLEMTAGGLPEIAAWLAGFGGKVRVLQPPKLRQRLQALHQAGLSACKPDPSAALTSDDKGTD